jgi:acetolactate synthase-1/2/3 large subunit
VLAKHETDAAFMAEAMASSTGRPGACLATLGPGATNLVTGVAHAYLDRSPLIALTGQLPVDRYEIVTHQKLDLRALFAPITKWQARVTAANAGAVTDRALRIALSPTPLDADQKADGKRKPEPLKQFERSHGRAYTAAGHDA